RKITSSLAISTSLKTAPLYSCFLSAATAASSFYTLSLHDALPIFAYGIDRQGLVDWLLYGRGQPINSPIAVQMWAFDEDAAVDYNYDPDKAMEMLDEAGYVDVDDDGFREDPEGNEWILNMDYPTGNELRERTAPLIQQQLEEIGIEVNLRKPKEMTAYVEDLTDDNSDWDLYLLGWSLGSDDPDPTGLWASDAPYNFSRWNNPDSDDLIKKALKAPEA